MANQSRGPEGVFSHAVAAAHALVVGALVFCAALGMWTARTVYPGHESLKLLAAAPDFELPSLTDAGSVVGLRQHRGRPTVVAFWSVWNADSVGSFILLEKLKREAADTVDILAVNIDRPRDAADAASLLREIGSTADVVWDGRGETLNAYHVWRLPAWFLIDTDGTLLAKGSLPTLSTEELRSVTSRKRG
jgi:thiol-disulfide isomerase/thioredoxin